MPAHHDIQALSERQLADYDARTPGTIFAEPLDLTVDEAYAVQTEVSRLRERRGERVIGYKVGCTTPTIQQRFGISHPVFGRLFESEVWPSGVSLPASQYESLAIEGELAVRVTEDIHTGELTPGQANACLDSAFAVIELHQLVFRRESATAIELIANNAIHAGFVSAQQQSTAGRPPGRMRIEINGLLVAAVRGPLLTETVATSLSWLVGELHTRGLSLKSGQIVLCGSIADLFPVDSSSKVVVTTDQFGSVECTIE